MRYIADKYEHQGTPNLHRPTSEERAHVKQWTDVVLATFQPVIQPVLFELLRPGAYKQLTDDRLVAKRTEKLVELLYIFKAQLAKQRFVAGEFVSLADLAHLPCADLYLQVLEKRELLQSRLQVAAWVAEICSCLAWKKVVAGAATDYES